MEATSQKNIAKYCAERGKDNRDGIEEEIRYMDDKMGEGKEGGLHR